MKKRNIISAWRDQDSFQNLSDEEKQSLPAHPAGLVDIAYEDLVQIAGGEGTHYSFCEPTASWCDDCSGEKEILIAAR